MNPQNYSNHRRFVFLYHVVLALLLIATIIGAAINVSLSIGDHQRIYSASLILVLSAGTLLTALFARSFALKAQDRAIRAEENLRHFVLTGTLLDHRLTTRQIIGLRFAPDDEFLALAKRAADEQLSEDAIKKAVKNWKPDYYRA